MQDRDTGFADVLDRAAHTIQLSLTLGCAEHDLVVQGRRQVFDDAPIQLVAAEEVTSPLKGFHGDHAVDVSRHAADHVGQPEGADEGDVLFGLGRVECYLHRILRFMSSMLPNLSWENQPCARPVRG